MVFKKVTSIKKLKLMSNTIRQDLVKMLCEAKSGHPAGSLGLVEAFTVLYFNVMNHDPMNPLWEGRDRMVVSNGHIAPVIYASLANAGYFPREELMTLRKFGSRLQGHPHRGSLPGIETSSGPLGQGLSQAAGMALVGKRENKSWRVYGMISDGEMQEGQIWEAVMFASKYKLDNLTVILDRNNIQIDGTTEEVMPLEPVSGKFRSFGWNVIDVNGHDIKALVEAYEQSKKCEGKPTLINARIVPGKGVSYMEHKNEWHGKTPNKELEAQALTELAAECKLLMEESE